MWNSQLWAAVPVTVGVLVLGAAYTGMHGLMREHRAWMRSPDTRALRGLTAAFLLAYAAVLAAVLHGRMEPLLALVGAVLLLGAVFVLLVVRLGRRTLRALTDANLSVRQLSEIHDATGDAFALVDAEGTVRVANRRLAELVQRPASEIVGKPVAAAFASAPAGELPRGREDPPYRGEGALLRGSGDASVPVFVCIAHAGPELGLVYLFEDIRGERRRQRRLDEAVRIAEDAVRGRLEYTARLTRELQEPLAALTQACDRMDAVVAAADVAAATAAIEATGRTAVRALQELLSAGRQGRASEGSRVFYPTALLQDTADTLSADAARVGSEVRVEVAAGVPTHCRGCEAEIREVLELIGTQVLRRAPHDELVLAVACAADDAHRLVFSASAGRPVVRSTSPSDTSIMLTPDREARSAAVDLVVGRLIALSFGGALTVEPRAEAPARYAFTAPVDGAPALVPAVMDADAAPSPQREVSQVLAALATSHARPGSERQDARGAVLVVDDSATTRSLLAQLLTRDGLEVAVAATAREALSIVWERPFDVVLLDVELPDGDGIAVLGQLRELGALERLAVLMISAVEDSGVVAACIEQGAEDYLVKPVSPVVLRARIGACFEKKLLRERSRQQLIRLAAESRRASQLLHTLLPDVIAEELQATGEISPRRHERVAVMFADIVDFTRYCDRHPPEEVLVALQALFTAVESLAQEHGVLKVKTIGDAIMLAAGLFDGDANPAASCVALGKASLAAIARLPTGWAVRIGVHVGPVVSGIAGLRQYRFDIWGDTVNVAQRIEQFGTPGVVCVSAAVRDAVAGIHTVRSRGTTMIKGKGELEIFEVVEGPT